MCCVYDWLCRYPKLAYILEAMFERLAGDTTMKVRFVAAITNMVRLELKLGHDV